MILSWKNWLFQIQFKVSENKFYWFSTVIMDELEGLGIKRSPLWPRMHLRGYSWFGLMIMKDRFHLCFCPMTESSASDVLVPWWIWFNMRTRASPVTSWFTIIDNYGIRNWPNADHGTSLQQIGCEKNGTSSK